MTMDTTLFLPETYEPCHNTVIVGARGKHAKDHPGNKACRAILRRDLDAYQQASRSEKTCLIVRVVHEIKSKSKGGVGFVRKELLLVSSSNGQSGEGESRWVKLETIPAKMYIGQAFRDLSRGLYKSGRKCKSMTQLSSSPKSPTKKRAAGNHSSPSSPMHSPTASPLPSSYLSPIMRPGSIVMQLREKTSSPVSFPAIASPTGAEAMYRLAANHSSTVHNMDASTSSSSSYDGLSSFPLRRVSSGGYPSQIGQTRARGVSFDALHGHILPLPPPPPPLYRSQSHPMQKHPHSTPQDGVVPFRGDHPRGYGCQEQQEQEQEQQQQQPRPSSRTTNPNLMSNDRPLDNLMLPPLPSSIHTITGSGMAQRDWFDDQILSSIPLEAEDPFEPLPF